MQNRFGKNIFFILSGAVLVIIIVIIFIVLRTNQQDQPNIPPSPTPNALISIIPTPTSTGIKYKPGSAQKMIDKLVTRVPLSSTDAAAKAKILSLLPSGQVSGVLYRSPTVIIDYTNAADEFQGEIITIDIAQAKRDAASWFLSQGLSQQALCDLPVVFYINRGASNQLRNLDIVFSPLAEGC